MNSDDKIDKDCSEIQMYLDKINNIIEKYPEHRFVIKKLHRISPDIFVFVGGGRLVLERMEQTVTKIAYSSSS